MNFDDCDSGAEPRELLLFDLRLLVDLRDGAFDDFEEERRAGITTTGMPPLLITSRRDFPFKEAVLTLVFDFKLF